MNAAAPRPDRAVAVRPLAAADHPLVHRWVRSPHAVYWEMTEAGLADVVAEYEVIAARPHHHAHLGLVDGTPTFLVEVYDPARSELAGRYAGLPGDVGMHVLVAPTDTPVPGTTDLVMAAVLRWCLAQPGAQRVVVEPDERNAAIRAKNRAAGFTEVGRIPLASKTAMLSVATRASFAASRIGGIAAGLDVVFPEPALPLLPHDPKDTP